ncbi:MAG: hypothetical protein HY731_03555 [Candidatus Tectomicrobia bacterium]|nr:hypothetical protein [Candidatus Tectomicrobia bacterium]
MDDCRLSSVVNELSDRDPEEARKLLERFQSEDIARALQQKILYEP